MMILAQDQSGASIVLGGMKSFSLHSHHRTQVIQETMSLAFFLFEIETAYQKGNQYARRR